MWLNISLDDVIFQIKIENYKHNDEDTDYWTETSIRLKFRDIINYSIDDYEILTSLEINKLKSLIKELLNDTLDTSRTLTFVEPDLSFVAYPGDEKSLELNIKLWPDLIMGTSIILYEDSINLLYSYLQYITGEN